MLEAFGHFDPMMADPEALFTATMRAQLDQLGMPHSG